MRARTRVMVIILPAYARAREGARARTHPRLSSQKAVKAVKVVEKRRFWLKIAVFGFTAFSDDSVSHQ